MVSGFILAKKIFGVRCTLSSLYFHDVATCVGMAGHTHATFSTFSTQHKLWLFTCPWHATSGTSAHALVQQCRVNVVKRVQHQTTSKMLCPTMLQNVASKCLRRLATFTQHYGDLASTTGKPTTTPILAIFKMFSFFEYYVFSGAVFCIQQL